MTVFDLYPLIEEILQKHSRVVIAIDGGAASGKTTLAEMLSGYFQGFVIHMDDFFLRSEQRTAERLSEPGGNVDRERFIKEVSPHLHKQTPFSYRRFDCSKMALGKEILVPDTKLLIVEGSYSQHPAFGDLYDLTIFVETDEMIRKERILKRNGQEKYEMFLKKWIPLENKYFEFCSIRQKADIVITG